MKLSISARRRAVSLVSFSDADSISCADSPVWALVIQNFNRLSGVVSALAGLGDLI